MFYFESRSVWSKVLKSFNLIYKNERSLADVAGKLANHPNGKMLIQVFSGSSNFEELKHLHTVLVSFFPGVPIIGTTADGSICNTTLVDSEITINISIFEDTEIETIYVESSQFYKLNSNVVAKLTQTQPALCILFSAAVNNAQILNTSKLVEAISDIVPQTKIAGGQACVANKLKNTYVFNEQKILSRGAVFALFSNKNLNVSLFMSDGWKQIGMPLQVELSGERCVRKINGMSVRDIYQEYLDIPLKIGDLSHPTMQFPLMIRRGNLLKKNVPIAELEDGCVQFFNTFHKDDDVRFSYCDVSELEREVSEIKSEILLEAPEAIFFFSCSIRKKLFGLPVPIDTNELCKAAPTCSAFLSTEYYSDKRSESSSSFIQSLVGLTMSESKREPLEFKNATSSLSPYIGQK